MLIPKDINRIPIGAFFQLYEFQCPCCHQVILHPLLFSKLKGLRHKIGQPVIITSGYRCPCYNRKIGGIKNSYHLYGMAADIYVPGIGLKEVLKIAREMGFGGIGFYQKRNFLHLDIRSGEKQAYWQG